MPKHISSWRERRWKIFEKVYNSNLKFRNELKTFKDYDLFDSMNNGLDEVLMKYGVPSNCWPAAAAYINNPETSRVDLMKKIMPPIFFWNAVSKKMGPKVGALVPKLSPSLYFELLFRIHESQHYLAMNVKELDFKDFPRLIAGNTTVLQVMPYVTKSEMHELIDDYWNELKPLFSQQSTSANLLYRKELLGKIQPAKSENINIRNNMIILLSDAGLSDRKILWELGKSGYDVSEANLRSIRYRNKK